MHRRAREHVGLVEERKFMKHRRRFISGFRDWWKVLHGCSIELYDVHCNTTARIFRRKPEDVNAAEGTYER